MTVVNVIAAALAGPHPRRKATSPHQAPERDSLVVLR